MANVEVSYFGASRTKSENEYFGNQVKRSNDGDDSDIDDESYHKPSSIYLHKGQQYTETGVRKPLTPDTHLTLPSKQPDVALYCKKCKEFINLIIIQEHRKYHKALETLGYTDTEPDNVEALLTRRKELLQNLISETDADNLLNPKIVQKINEAVEYLKADLEQTYETLRRHFEFIDMNVEGVSLNCSPPCVQSVGFCSWQNERWKSTMEDARVFQDYFGNDVNKSFFGIYDGHNGRFAAEVCANKLHQLLLQEITRFDPMTLCTCTYNMCECNDISQYESERPTTCNSERVQLHEESTNVIHQIIHTCEDNLNNMLLKELQDVANSQKIIDRITRKSRNHENPKDPYSEKMEIAYKKAYHATDHYLTYGLDEQSKVRWSGCSALSVMINNTGNTHLDSDSSVIEANDNPPSRDSPVLEAPRKMGMIYVANAGNAHAVLVRDNKAYRLSKDHTPTNKRERDRVLKSGGTISDSEKYLQVNGVLSTTRGLGNHGDIRLRKAVISEPSTTCIELDQYAQVLILATDGVWQVLSPQDATDIVLQMLPTDILMPPSRVSTSLKPLLKEYNEFLERQKKNKIKNFHDDQEKSDLENNYTFGQQTTEDIFQNSDSDEVISNEGVNTLIRQRPDTGKSNTSKVSFKEENEDYRDIKTEIGSNLDDDSGNEGDIETITEAFSISESRLSRRSLSKEEIHREFAKAMAERLVQAALLAGSKDNVTVMIVLLQGSGL
ncbi:protein phosphatase 2C-like domain-containing protein 1 isoform X2 [Tubulanus polymorphus]|uniref:protein phosphatase 2C-like domain-containing protein 1 isoform X2 n=1 Tax=Tubulanus polymorphus TaxID=672921 RepID=UPI003DA47B36